MSLIDFGKQMNQFFSRGENSRSVSSGSPAPKKREGAKEPPFTFEQADFLQEAHGAAFNAYGAVLQKKFDSIEQNINAGRKVKTDQPA